MSWYYADFKKWISSGCPEVICEGRAELVVADTVRALYLGNNNLTTLNLTTLPKCVGQLVNLREFSLSDNKLTTLPECVGQLLNLEVLDLGNNNLTTLPECVGQLVNL